MSNDTATRLAEARAKAGYISARDAAAAFGWTYSTYAAHENGNRKITVEAGRRYARAFQVSASWLLWGTKEEDLPPEPVSVPVIGKVAAGVWFDADSYSFEDDTWIPAVRAPEFRNGRQVAYKVEGPSMNRVLPDGVYAIGVLIEGFRDPRHDDIVVLNRYRGGLVETTIKRFVVQGGSAIYMPDSDDPRFQTPIKLDTLDEDVTVEIRAIVVGSYKPI
jgi:SOS-response transcriptional repressor LexA